MRLLPYAPDQAWLLPPSVQDVLGEDHLCFFVHRAVEKLDLRGLSKVGAEVALACAAFNLTRLWRQAARA